MHCWQHVPIMRYCLHGLQQLSVCVLTRPDLLCLLCQACRWRTRWPPIHVTWSEHRHGKRRSPLWSVLQRKVGSAAGRGGWALLLPAVLCMLLRRVRLTQFNRVQLRGAVGCSSGRGSGGRSDTSVRAGGTGRPRRLSVSFVAAACYTWLLSSVARHACLRQCK